MKLVRALRVDESIRLAFVGAGGKTTALFQLARQLHPPVLVAASTHLQVSQTRLADHAIVINAPGQVANCASEIKSGVQLFTGPEGNDGRTSGLPAGILAELCSFADQERLPLLIEADGSRRLPLKAPAGHEPPIPAWVQMVVVCAGLSGLGQPLDDARVFRAEEFARISGSSLGAPVTADALVNVLTHPEGGLKNIPVHARRVALLNQADREDLCATADWLAGRMLPAYHSVLVASLEQNQVHRVHEPTAGIILAAGDSRRLGRPKQLLDWRGEFFVRHVARAALGAGLSPVVVVLGAAADEVKIALQDLPVIPVFNPAWESGQAASIRAGLQVIPEATGGAVFLLADQPQVSTEVLLALISAHSRNLDPIIAPVIEGRRANPVLFDRDTFRLLSALQGDLGGRAIFNRVQVTLLPWDDASLLLDVDTPDDYQRLKGLE